MKWAYFLLIELCFVSGLMCGLMHPGTFVLASALSSFGAFISIKKKKSPRYLRSIIFIFYASAMGLSVVPWPGFRPFLLQTCLNLVWLMLVWRAYHHEKLADRVQVSIIALLPMICVAVMLPATLFLPVLLAYLIVWTCFLCSQALQRPTTGAAVQVSSGKPIFVHGFKRRAFLALFAAILLGGALFLALPRWSGSAAPIVPGVTRQAGAFPDVALDKTGTIDLDPSLVFRADVPKDHPSAMYWRIEAQNAFDGVRWRSLHPTSSQKPLKPNPNLPLLRLDFTRNWRDYHIPTPVGTDFVSLTDEDLDKKQIHFYRDQAGIWYRWGWNRGEPLYAYQFQLYTILERSPHFDTSNIWPADSKNPASKPLTDLAQNIVGNASSNAEKAAKIRDYLQKNYAYSLDRPVREGNIVEDFLFTQKYGHCEMFSTAMAVLLARLEVPVRNVTGFVSDEFRDGRNYVRSAHAHSWVEVYLDEPPGWAVFDPTPSGPQTVQVNWILRIDDWFAAYKPMMLYQWIDRHIPLFAGGFAILAALFLIWFFPVRMAWRRTKDVRTVSQMLWGDLHLKMANSLRCRDAAAKPLEYWWTQDGTDCPAVQQFARRHIALCYQPRPAAHVSLPDIFRENTYTYRLYRRACREIKSL